MDWQMQEDDNFTNLLYEESRLDNELMGSPNLMGQMSPSQVEIESSAKKSRGSNFTIKEDNLLVSAWLNTCLDSVKGNEQEHKTYWWRIWEYFHENKTFISERTEVSLTHRWSAIHTSTKKFCGYLSQIESMHQSGLNEQDKVYILLNVVSMHQPTNSDRGLIVFYFFFSFNLQIIKAKLMFQEFEKISFQFEHCWNVLRCQPQWINGKKKSRKRTFATTYSPTLDLINLEDDDSSTNHFVDLEIPQGRRKAEKERLNKRKSKKSASADVVETLNEIKEEMKSKLIEETSIQEQDKLHNMHERERLRFKQEKLQAEQAREDDKIMLMDTSGLSEIQKEYIHHRQMEVLENRRKKPCLTN
jgi:hypothetical protein